MDEPSDRARDVVASYRRARMLEPDAHARVHERLLASIEQGAIVDDEPPLELAAPRRRSVLTIAAIALATAAGVILAAKYLAAQEQRAAIAPRGDEEAVYGQRDAPEPHALQRPAPAEPPARVQPAIEAPSVTTPPPSPRRATPPTTVASDQRVHDTGLAAENALIAAASSALARGDHTTALARLAEHARSFPAGQLAEERAALRIEALCAAGKHVQGRAEAKLFLRNHPGATQSARVEAACR